jgi:Xaa-Pro aminopeptidase
MLLNKARAVEAMRQAGVDGIIVTSLENVAYVSGYLSFSQRLIKATQVYAVLSADRPDEAVLVAPIGDLDGVAQRAVRVQVQSYGAFPVFSSPAVNSEADQLAFLELVKAPVSKGPADALMVALSRLELKGKRLALDATGLTPPLLEELNMMLGPDSTVEGWGLMRQIRMVKTPEEVARLKQASSITEAAIDDVLKSAHEGMTEHEMAYVFNNAVLRRDAMPLLTCIGVGSRSALPDVVPSQRRLKKGDIIRFDVGCVYDWYCSDLARIACFGDPPAKAAAYYSAVLCGEREAIGAVKPGARTRDIFRKAVDATRSSGIPHYERHHCGHGIGLECYDMPSIAPGDETVLEPGMVINIETPYYELGFAGLQVEDTVVVTRDGAESLSVSDRSLRVVKPVV